jgi:chorismate synthase
MAGNTFGTIFRLTTFGESHGIAIGGIVDGVPAGLKIDTDKIQQALDRRRPGQSNISSPRQETDCVKILSGIFEEVTTGAPIGFQIDNKDYKSSDYDHLREVYRPSHADYTYQSKYGIRDYRGGGRSSARETACRVVAGAIASQFLAIHNIKVYSWVSSIGDISLPTDYVCAQPEEIDKNTVRCPDTDKALQMEQLILEMRNCGDSVGGCITTIVKGVPAGLGEPVFDKLHADLAKAVMSINAVKGFEIGSGFRASTLRGTEHNDAFTTNAEGKIITTTNNSGGIQGGISNGMDIIFRAAFKPVATIQKIQNTLNTDAEEVTLEAHGRHDPCVVPRAVPIVEAMTALTLADHLLRSRTSRI